MGLDYDARNLSAWVNPVVSPVLEGLDVIHLAVNGEKVGWGSTGKEGLET
jgi:hypothetical protein